MPSGERNDEECDTRDDDCSTVGDLINNKFTFPRQKQIEKVKFNILGLNFKYYYGRSNTSKD